jgi:ParB family chromosome partitioning protein
MSNNDAQREIMKSRILAQAQATKAQTASISLDDRFNRLEARQSQAMSGPVDSNPQTSTKFIDPDAVKDRSASLRGISKDHVVDLAFSIAALGCIHFPVVDHTDTLLAGEHRLQAVRLLRGIANMPFEELKERFAEYAADITDEELMSLGTGYARHFPNGLPVHVMQTVGLDADQLRMRIEIVENEKRRDFSREDLQGIVTRLKEAGYKSTGGRPQPGQLILSHELGRIMGKSRPTVFRALKKLSEPNGDVAGDRTPSKASTDQGRVATEILQTKVQIKEGSRDKGESGTIVIHYSSFRHRAELLRTLGLKE